MRKLRIVLAAVSFALATMLFLDFTNTLAPVAGWIARIQFAPAVLALSFASLAIVLLTLVLGRVYCSVVCPLGIFQDIVIFFRKLFGKRFFGGSPAENELKARKWVRLGFLGMFAGGGFLGLHFVWLEPYAIYGRFVSFVLSPLYRMGNNALASWAEKNSSYMFRAVEIVLPCTAALVAGIALVAAIIAMTLWRGRLWCNTVCPVGTFLGFFARFSFFKIKIDEGKCVKCGACEKLCKAQCIDATDGKVDFSRCVGCFDCVKVCPKKGVSFKR